jgi:hypothetical protein
MVYDLGYQKRPVAVRSRNFEKQGAYANVALHRLSVAVTCDLKGSYRGRFHDGSLLCDSNIHDWPQQR